MFDIVRRRLPIAIAAALALALTGQAALAQSGDEISPSAIQNINVQKVDGRSAIKFNNDPSKRGGYLVAASADGYLPNNIIQKALDSDLLDGLDSTAFATLAALRSATGAINEADNLVHWNQLFGVPAQIADGLDGGITSLAFTQVAGPAVAVAANGNVVASVNCPAGSVPVSGGHAPDSFLVFNVTSFRAGAGWTTAARNTDPVNAHNIQPVVHCVTAVPSTSISSFSVAKKKDLKSANSNKPPRPKGR